MAERTINLRKHDELKCEHHTESEACSAYRREERRIQGFGVQTSGKETTWEIQA